MKVTIWDLDYYYTKKDFNIECMKISSFHKQKGDSINFVTNEFQVEMEFNLMYITKKSLKVQAPPLWLLENSKVRVWGEGFKYFTNYALPPVIAACRPDYLLYPEKATKKQRAEMVQFFDYRGNLLRKTQDYHNTFHNKNTLVVDQYF